MAGGAIAHSAGVALGRRFADATVLQGASEGCAPRRATGASHDSCMSTRNRHPRRGLEHETPGSVDYPFDTDPQNPNAAGLQSDSACTVPWRADGFEAIQVFVDPALRERAGELCSVVSTWADSHRDLDSLSEAALGYSDAEDLSASIFDNPPDDLSRGTVAIAFTIG